MRNPLSIPPAMQPPTMLSPAMASALVAVVAALSCTPLLAGEIDDVANDVAKFNVSNTSEAGISWMSGGIGEDARDEMRKAASGYNVLVVFSGRHGAYLSGIPFTVTRRDGREVFSGITDGPLLYVKLPAATYRFSAQIDGDWQSKRIQAGSSGPPVRMMFVSRGD